tara:strand:- start:607 stop:771 length:165 start_codon:yes stop_codon:yes gene_type:complete
MSSKQKQQFLDSINELVNRSNEEYKKGNLKEAKRLSRDANQLNLHFKSMLNEMI